MKMESATSNDNNVFLGLCHRLYALFEAVLFLYLRKTSRKYKHSNELALRNGYRIMKIICSTMDD